MALTLATELADYASGIGTQGATLKIDADNKRVGVGTTNPQGPEGTLQVGTGITFFGNTGIISAIGGKFSGDFTVGGTLTYEDVQNVNSSGIVTAQSGINVVGGGLTVTGVSTFFSALDVNSTADFAGAISVGDTISLGDHDRLRFGAGNDLQIFHNGTDSKITNTQGNLIIDHSDGIIRLDPKTNENGILIRPEGAVELFHNNSKKFETGPAGTITVGVGTFDGLSLGDSEIAKFGNDNDLQIYHDGNNSYIQDGGTGHLVIRGEDIFIANTANDTTAAGFDVDGSVDLYHNGTKKFETTSGGVEVSSGNLTMQSNGRIFVGDGGNATNPMFANVSDTNTGIAFPAADTMMFTTGGGERLRLASAGVEVTGKLTFAADGVSNGIELGADADLLLYHDDSDGYLDNDKGDFYIRNSGSNSNQVYISGKGGENGIIVNGDGSVELYHDNSKKLETSASGVTVTGSLNATANLRINGAAVATNGKAVAMALVFG